MPPPAGIAERYLEITRRIQEACVRSRRRPEDVVLVGASKTQPPAVLAEAWRAGLRVFGENRVQEAVAKSRELQSPPYDIEWHLIGPLQSNKVRTALDLFRAVHSVDRPRIAETLDQEAGRRSLQIPGLLEINLGGEESKHGFPPEGLAEAVRPLAGLEHLKIVGLMAIPPQADNPEGSRPWFRRLRELRDELGGRPEWPGFPGWLSMGMSHDFEVAVEEGATHVRVGTLLFGSRT
ncbi:MAG TPA: YggS family pyridoxal phosphate-dependent enzyme [Thermoanaerobaculia bacterium]|nr:YggS family pyridoxal phosphate-dependent enzyme [Thermoanaerobaculia bacterium]